jgi:hypothetical protein
VTYLRSYVTGSNDAILNEVAQRGVALDMASSKSVSDDEGEDVPLPQMTDQEQ